MADIKKFAFEPSFRLDDEEIRKTYKEGLICVLYGSDLYSTSFEYIREIREVVKEEYPNILDVNIEIWKVTRGMSNRHANMMMLLVPIPVEDFLKLREEGKIGIL